jgi:hypothetical protein
VTPRSVLLFAALLSCSDTGFSPINPGDDPDPDPDTGTDPGDDTDPPPPEPCEVAPAPAADAAIDEACRQASLEIDDPWNVRIKWQYTVPSGSGSYVMPVVGNLSDDNGDGRIDTDDQPDIVFTSLAGEVIALHGDGSGVLWRVSGMNGNAGLTLADVDNDGLPEVVGLSSGSEVVAIRHDGTFDWRSARVSGLQSYPQPAVADLEGDGTVEIVMDRAVVAGADGAVIRSLPDPGVSWRAPVIADIDDDGISEILLGRHAFRADGTIAWSVGPSSNGDSCFAAVADIDGDRGGETFWVWGSSLYVRDHDGTAIRTVALPTSPSRPGPPSIADFDGDGAVEIVVPMNTQIGMFEVDGTMRWSQTMRDNSGIAGVSGYDVDGDGAFEAIFADEIAMRIYDGVDGTIRYENFSHQSGTVWEYPVIADVDNDGSAEIVIASMGSTWRGITVFEHAGGGWAEAGPTWPTHDFAVTNINPDLSVPSPAPKPWITHNVFRARPVVDQFSNDLRIQITDVCVTGCLFDDQVQVAVQVYNTGALPVPPGVKVALYAARDDGRTLLDTWTVPDEVPAGRMLPGHVFTLQAGRLGPLGVVAVVDDDGTGAGAVYECQEDNNEDAWGPSPCE